MNFQSLARRVEERSHSTFSHDSPEEIRVSFIKHASDSSFGRDVVLNEVLEDPNAALPGSSAEQTVGQPMLASGLLLYALASSAMRARLVITGFSG